MNYIHLIKAIGWFLLPFSLLFDTNGYGMSIGILGLGVLIIANGVHEIMRTFEKKKGMKS